MIDFAIKITIKKDDLCQEQFKFRLFDHPMKLKCISYELLERKTKRHKFKIKEYWSLVTFYNADTLDKAPLTEEVCQLAQQKLIDIIYSIPIGE